MPPLDGVFCCIRYPDRSRYNTTGTSLFDAAAKALKWVEVSRQSFGTARRFHDDEVLDRRRNGAGPLVQGENRTGPALDPRERH